MFNRLDLPDWMDQDQARQIARLRGLGYKQHQIADRIGVSQQTVSRYVQEIRKAALRREEEGGTESLEDFFLVLALGYMGYKLLQSLGE